MMKVSASKICNGLNHTKIAFNQKNGSYLDVTNDVRLNQQKYEWE